MAEWPNPHRPALGFGSGHQSAFGGCGARVEASQGLPSMAGALLTRPALEVRGQHLGSTMQMLGWVGSKGVSARDPKSSESLAEFTGQWAAIPGCLRQTEGQGLTDPRGLHLLPVPGTEHCCLWAAADTGTGAMGRALRCSNSQGNTRHRSMLLALAKHCARWRRATSGKSTAGGPGPSWW